MSNEITMKKLRQLSSDLVLVDATSPLDEWAGIGAAADDLAALFLQDGDGEAQDVATHIAKVAKSMSKGIIANPEAGVKAIQSLIGVLQDLDGGPGIIESHRKQAIAEANLFFRDAKKEETRVSAATDFEDDDEKREMIMAIEQRIDELENDLLALNPPVTDSDEVRAIFRQFHTLKGEGAICGIKSVAEFCHGIETEIEDARSGGLILTNEIVSVLQELTAIIRPILAGDSREEIGEDLIKALMDELRLAVAESKESGAPEPVAEDEGEDKFADFFSGFAPPPDDPEDAEESETDADAAVPETPIETGAPEGEPPVEVAEAAPSLDETEQALLSLLDEPSTESSGDPADKQEDGEKKSELADTATIRAEEARELAENLSAADFLDTLACDVKADKPSTAETTQKSPTPTPPPTPAASAPPAKHSEANKPFQPAFPPPPKPSAASRTGEDTVIESRDLASVQAANSATAIARGEILEKKVEDTKVKAISVDVNRLDDLLEIVGEVSLIGSYVTTQLQGQENLSLQTTNLLRACARLQEVANSMRMTSIRPLFMTIRRAAADAARASRKMIDINMQGIDTQVDRSIVESLSAALIHIIRNAVDHGIEVAEVRRRAGKPQRGVITISASRTNSDIVIELGDDGQGFDLDAIHEKAVAMGKIAPDATLTNEELADLVFLPGLSTAKRITGLSGRGVGMEIVRESIDSLRGKVEIRTVHGKGSTVRMRFPLMVAAMDAMMVKVGANILALPVSQVRECFRPTKDDIGTIEGRGTIVTIRGVILPVLFLGQEFGIAGEAQRPEDGVLVVVETGEMLAAVLVDETLGSSQVVIRSLEGPLAQSQLVAGAAVLPDGSIGLVIETTKLTERVATTASKAFNDAGKRQAESSRQIDTVSIGSNQVGMIDFNIMAPGPNDTVRTHVFAINAFKTREFVPLTKLRSIPGSPTGFAGMMMLRDTTVPVVHMGVVLGLLNDYERREEWEQIVLVCEFSGKTVGFLVSSVERVSYISWEDIMPPPSTGGLIQIEYVVGTILMSKLKGTLANKRAVEGNGNLADGTPSRPDPTDEEAQVAFVLDFERIVGNVLELYGDMGSELGNMGGERREGVRVLLVEDSPLIRKQTNKALSAAGITVIEAGDGQEAWEKIEELRQEADAQNESIFTRVDLILSDIEMPRMDGYTLTYNIKHDPGLRVLPVLLHSSITNDSMISRATEVEADGFIPKCDPKELADQLKKYL
ncbi:MAG: chemotaxis protein CheW [Planctomycetaceae bacterium]|nr:chemotaxis protein CheW [Planctomycetaceae bacterium]